MCSRLHFDPKKETYLDQRNSDLHVPDERECVLKTGVGEELLTKQLFS